MRWPSGTLIRDLLAGGVPWLPYWLGVSLGHPALGAVLAACALLGLRFSAWREFKVFDLAILIFFVWVGVDRCCLRLDQLEPLRPLLLPLLLACAAFGSMALQFPCTMQYAREMVGPAWWENYHFIRVNHILTAVWGLSFLGMAVLASCAPVVSAHPRIVTGIGSIALFALAAWFTRDFPRWYRMHKYLPLVRAGKEPFLRSPRR